MERQPCSGKCACHVGPLPPFALPSSVTIGVVQERPGLPTRLPSGSTCAVCQSPRCDNCARWTACAAGRTTGPLMRSWRGAGRRVATVTTAILTLIRGMAITTGADCDNPRTVIEIASSRMSKKARRELRRLVVPADERKQRRLLRNPFAHVDLPWWLQTFGDYN
jgi:hypothetical protein